MTNTFTLFFAGGARQQMCLVLVCIACILALKSNMGLPEFATKVTSIKNPALKAQHTSSAYFTLLAGIDPHTSKAVKSPHSYLGYLLHLATVRYMLDYVGSTMDFVILVKLEKTMAHPNRTSLLRSQEAFFSKLNMKIEYLPQGGEEDFEHYMMEKFNIFRYHEYNHILFLDADVLPLCNLDVYFDMSDQGILAPNFVIAYKHEPAQGGFFLISPEPGDWEKYQAVHEFVNATQGFGSPLDGLAEDMKRNYTSWSWHGSVQDQGFLYHWVRYVKKNVTVLNKNRIQKWGEQGNDGQVKVVHENLHFSTSCKSPRDVWRPENSDFVHFTGQKKPWIRNWTATAEIGASGKEPDEEARTDVQKVWAVVLKAAWRKYDLGPLRDLIPNMPNDPDIKKIEAFLESSSF
jgi:hypothetical protein